MYFQCAMKGEGNRVEVERLPHLSELAHEGQAVEIASVQDPETGATRYQTISSNQSLPPTNVVGPEWFYSDPDLDFDPTCAQKAY